MRRRLAGVAACRNKSSDCRCAAAPPTVPRVTGRGRHRLAASVLVVALGAACGGGGGASRTRARHARGRRLAPVARRAPGPTTTAADGAGRRAGRVPTACRRRPSSIAAPTTSRSRARCVEYGRWLEWHHPDPALVDRAYAPGSELARDMARDGRRDARARERIAEVDARRSTSSCVSTLAERRVVPASPSTSRAATSSTPAGARSGTSGPATEHYVVSIMRFAADAPWRLNCRRAARPADRGAAVRRGTRSAARRRGGASRHRSRRRRTSAPAR